MLQWIIAIALFFSVVPHARAGSEFLREEPPFTRTLSNTFPLAFGMTAEDVTHALGSPLQYLKGRPGNETFFVIRTGGGSGFFARRDRLFLQFRRGRLTGFKGDWGDNWMWR